MSWETEVVKISDYFTDCGDDERIQYLRAAVTALRQELIGDNVNFYDLYTKISQNVTELCTPSVMHLILQSMDYPEQDLVTIRSYITDTQYNLQNNICFDLMLSMISTVRRMDQPSYMKFKTLSARLLKNSLNITSRAKYLQRLYQDNAMTIENATLFRSYLEGAGCSALHGHLTDFCERRFIQVPDLTNNHQSSINVEGTRACAIKATIISLLIVILTLFIGVTLRLLASYNYLSNSNSTQITLYGVSTHSVCYDTFKVKEVSVAYAGGGSNFNADIFVSPLSQIPHSQLWLPEMEHNLNNVPTPNMERIPVNYHTEATIICNPSGTLTYNLYLDHTPITPCPAQIYLFDSQNTYDTFRSEERLGYPPSNNYFNTSGCLNSTGLVNVTFPLLPDTLYHVGMYVAKSVTLRIFVSAELTRINTTGLSKVCNISSSSPCTVSLIGSNYPIHQDSVCVLISSSSSGNVTLTTIPVIWNVYSLSGIIGFPVFLATIGILVVIAMALCVRQYCSCRRNTDANESDYSRIA